MIPIQMEAQPPKSCLTENAFFHQTCLYTVKLSSDVWTYANWKINIFLSSVNTLLFSTSRWLSHVQKMSCNYAQLKAISGSKISCQPVCSQSALLVHKIVHVPLLQSQTW